MPVPKSDTEKLKTCTLCKQPKSTLSFQLANTNRRTLQARCRSCRREVENVRRAKDVDKARRLRREAAKRFRDRHPDILRKRQVLHRRRFRETLAEYNKKARQRRKVEGERDGHCRICIRPCVGNTVVCEHHWYKSRARQRLNKSEYSQLLKNKIEEQNFRCYYTGLPLEIGVNASLDHKQASARFPDLKGNLDNVVWCLHHINIMKGVLTEEEFVEICRIVVERYGKGDKDDQKRNERTAFALRGLDTNRTR